MALTTADRQFLGHVGRLKIYLLVLAGLVFVALLLSPSSEMQMATLIVGLALCGMFWLTQRLLALIIHLDLELTRLRHALIRSLPESQRREWLGQ